MQINKIFNYNFTQKTLFKPFPYFLSFLLGSVTVFSYNPYNQWFIIPITFAVMFFVNENQTNKQCSLAWFSYLLGKLFFGCNWLSLGMIHFTPLNKLESYLVMLLICFLCSLMHLLFGYLLGFISSVKHSSRARAIVFPALWCVFEYFRFFLYSGYPWLLEGYSLVGSVFYGLAPFIGAFGMTFVVCAIGSALYSLLKRDYLVFGVFSAFIALSLFVANFTSNYSYTKGHIKVATLQANIPQEYKWITSFRDSIFKKYDRMFDIALSKDSKIVILPETAFPLKIRYSDLPPRIKRISDNFVEHDATLITGMINYGDNKDFHYNSIGVLGNDYRKGVNFYTKRHLLPFGEYTPFSDLLKITGIKFSSFTSDASVGSSILSVQNNNILPIICFEIAFSNEILDRFNDNVDILLHSTNDTWFVDSIGPKQHIQVAQMRAAEFGRPLLRSNNNGYTAFIDYNGNIVKQSPFGKSHVMYSDIPLSKRRTFFSLYGHKPTLFLCFIIIAFAFLYKRNLNNKK